MGETTELTASDGHRLDAYFAVPQTTVRGGLVVVQEIFGLNGHIRQICDRYAEEGYLAIAPALFDRVGKRLEFGYGPEDHEKAMATRTKLEWDDALKDVAAAHDFARGSGKVGVVGYCYGGSVAWLAATRQAFACAISYYGGATATFSSEKPHCPTICHFGAQDRAITADKIDVIRKNRPEVPVYVYDGAGHGFNCDQRESWNEEAAQLAERRTLELLRTWVG